MARVRFPISQIAGSTAVSLWLGLAAIGAAPQSGQSALGPEDFVRASIPRDVQVSPDGRSVALVVTTYPDDQRPRRNIWMYDLPRAELWRFTTSGGSDTSPRWSPDSTTLAFLSDRGGKTQIYRISRDGGEAHAVTNSKTGAGAPAWSRDGKSLAFLAEEPPTAEEERREKEKDDARSVDRDDKPTCLWVVDLASGQIRQVTKAPLRLEEFVWLPSGDGFVAAATEDAHPETATVRVYRIALADGSARVVAAPAEPFGDIAVSPDGRILSWVGARSAEGLTAHDLFSRDLNGDDGGNLTASLDRPVASYHWSAPNRIEAVLEDGFGTRLLAIRLPPGQEALAGPPVSIRGMSSAGDTRAFIGSTSSQADELWVAKGSAEPVRVSHWNDALSARLAGPQERFTYRSFDGTSIEAALLLPPGAKAGARLPTVVLVHGGPTGRWADDVNEWGQLLAARGFAVLAPNIRGSTGYGLDFALANRRDWGGADYKDVMAGVDAIVAKGIADPERLGIGGWSYGGYMAAWAVTQTTRFKASVSGAPMTDLVSEWGTESAGTNKYDTAFLGAPYEDAEPFTRFSPVLFAGRVKTPVLLLCGEEDPIDPIGQCTGYYRALTRVGTATELVIYPREPHSFREFMHRVDSRRRMIEWFEQYLK